MFHCLRAIACSAYAACQDGCQHQPWNKHDNGLMCHADQDALLDTIGLHSKYIQKKCAHVKHHGLLHTMLQAAERAALSVTSAR